MPTSPNNTTVYAAPVLRKLAERVADLQPSVRKVADFMLRHPLKAATLTIEELAVETATSPAAVNRLAKAIDLGGYTGLKAELVGTLQQMVSPVDKLRNELVSLTNETRRASVSIDPACRIDSRASQSK